MTVLVTGGGGFLGGAIVEQLRARGEQVRSFARELHGELFDLGVEQHRGDLRDAEAVLRATAGVTQVIHVAAKVGAWGRAADFEGVNVGGTRNVIAACRRQGVRSLVFTSSPSVVFDGRDLEGVDESLPYPRKYDADYPRTKAAAEREVLAANGDGLRTVALRPHLVWGPRDTSLVARVVRRGRAGRLRRISGPAKLVDVCYVDDAARAHLLAMDRLNEAGEGAARVAGRAFFISSGEPIETWRMVDRILAAAGLPPVSKSVSPRVARMFGALLEVGHRALRSEREPALTRWVARELSTAHWFDISAARRQLGYEPQVGLEEGMARLAEWLRACPAK